MRNAEITSKSWLPSFNFFKLRRLSGAWGGSIAFKRVDPTFLALVAVLVGFGLLMLYSASFIYAHERFGDGLLFVKKQLAFAVLGSMALAIGSQIDYRRWNAWSGWLLLGATVLLALVLIPGLGARVGGAQRWIRLGWINVQPAEIAKLAIVAFAAAQLFRKKERVSHFTAGVLSHAIWVTPAFVLLLLQPDFGTIVISTLVMFCMMFLAGVRLRYLLGALVLAGSAGTALVLSSPYRMQRFLGYLDPWSDPLGKGFQILQSLMGFHNGQFFGVGLGNGKEKLFYLPEAHSDFIFAVIGEELGFLGVVGLIAAYVILIYKGFRIARTALLRDQSLFGMLLAAGLTVMLGLQGFVNMAVVMGLLPTKGLALPFVSYGGSALMMNLFAAGILLSIDRGPDAGEGKPDGVFAGRARR